MLLCAHHISMLHYTQVSISGLSYYDFCSTLLIEILSNIVKQKAPVGKNHSNSFFFFLSNDLMKTTEWNVDKVLKACRLDCSVTFHVDFVVLFVSIDVTFK